MSMYKVSIFRRAALVAAGLAAGVPALAAGNAAAEPVASVRAAAEGRVRAELRDVAHPVHVRASELDARLRLTHCGAPLAAELAPGAQPGARMSVRVSCGAPGSTWAVYVPVNVESDVTVLVLKQSAVRGARLSPADVVSETRRVPGLAVGYLTDIDTLPHRTTTRSLAAGTVLTADALLADCLVRQGQQVTLIASMPGISVRATGRVLQDGREGALVRVQNLASLKVVQGVVDASGEIEVTP